MLKRLNDRSNLLQVLNEIASVEYLSRYRKPAPRNDVQEQSRVQFTAPAENIAK